MHQSYQKDLSARIIIVVRRAVVCVLSRVRECSGREMADLHPRQMALEYEDTHAQLRWVIRSGQSNISNSAEGWTMCKQTAPVDNEECVSMQPGNASYV